jgi:rhomboid protease GluP
MNWKKLFDSLGLDGTRWQWRILRWQQRIRERGERQGAIRGKRFGICRRCGAFFEPGDRVCVRCGAKLPRVDTTGLRRALGILLPSWCPVSGLLLLANFAVFVACIVLFGHRNIWAPDSNMLVAMGALVGKLVGQGEWWRVITYGYLHIGLLHLLFNMFALSQVGPVLEEETGPARFFVLYTLSVAGGAVADLLVRGSKYIVVAGASGALFGLIGFGVSYAHFQGGYAGRAQRDFFARWALYGFLFGLFIGAANTAHAGGFVAGAALGWIIAKGGINRRSDFAWTAGAWLLGAVTVASYVWMLAAQ